MNYVKRLSEDTNKLLKTNLITIGIIILNFK